ncbi:hypothetical protein ACLOJK_028500 [Asimina triloba]
MKASIKLREERRPPLLRAKLPVSVLGLPFISSVCAGDPDDLSFHLRTSSPTGPSLKLSYFPNSPHNPFSLTVRTGTGPFGSPDADSPLLMSAHFNLFGASFPSFTLQIKPQFGDFSLKKLAASPAASLPAPFLPDPTKPNGDSHVPDVGNGPPPPLLGELRGGGVGFLSGAAVNARTVLPVTRRAMVKFRWGVNFNEQKLPFLTMDKIGIERVEEQSKRSSDDSMRKTAGELEVLKGMCFWIGREVEALQRENRGMKEWIEELRSGGGGRTRREIEILGKKPMEVAEGSSEFDRLRKKKNGGGEDRKAEAKPGGAVSGASANDVGEELKRAIKAASA